MKKIIAILLSTGILFTVLCAPVFVSATTSNNSSAQELIQTLQQQIEKLKAQIEALITQIESLRQAKLEARETTKEIKGTLKLIRHLRQGMSGEDVKLLQEVLATDTDVYPEGLVTGYFGPLTKNAVKRFQKIAGIEQVGLVGPKTSARINELLLVGAGKSGKVPPGLLIAPGIRKKVDLELLKPLPGQKLPPGIAKKLGVIGEDITPPVISNVTASNITGISAEITWTTDEEADSRIWYSTISPLVTTTDSTLDAISTDLVLDHEITLSDLFLDTIYYFIVNSTDEADNNEISEEETFTTLAE
ncbi:peptidoglycan-binding protein [Candidatus Parcubacteria bacterium]|nr:peptidoglycan-binding protein [Candidatus Parcubacteria bacterium]